MIVHEDGLALMLADIHRQSRVIDSNLEPLRDQAADLADRITGFDRVYLVGCGDSLDAGIATSYVWQRLTRRPTLAKPAMTFSSCEVDFTRPGSLVIALSQSGRVSRVLEAVRAARKRGATVVTVTAQRNSPLGQEVSDGQIFLSQEKIGPVPGTTSYMLGGLALLELACVLSSDTNEAEKVSKSTTGLPATIDATIAACETVAAQHADLFERGTPVLTLGYGPCLSCARFTSRKFLETSQARVSAQETEEYAHDEYSAVSPAHRVLQFAPRDRGLTRSREVASYLRELDTHLGVVTDHACVSEFKEFANVVYEMPSMSVAVAPLVYSIPGQLLSIHAARRLGGSLYGMSEPVHARDGDPQIYESEVVV